MWLKTVTMPANSWVPIASPGLPTARYRCVPVSDVPIRSCASTAPGTLGVSWVMPHTVEPCRYSTAPASARAALSAVRSSPGTPIASHGWPDAAVPDASA